MEAFKVACFVCSSVKKASPPKTKGILFGQEILFHTRKERGEFSLFDVRTRPQIISSQLPASPVKFDCTAQRGWAGNGGKEGR